MKKILDVPLFLQRPTETGCTAACARMVLAYGGRYVPTRRLIAELGIGKTNGATMQRLGNVFLKRGYAVTLVSTFSFVARDVFGATEKAARDILLRREFRPRTEYGRSLKEFLDNGGRCEIRPVIRDDLRCALKDGIPPIIGVNATTLWRTRVQHGVHVVVMTGLRGRTCHINDPYREFADVHDYDYERLMHACYVADGDALFVRPK